MDVPFGRLTYARHSEQENVNEDHNELVYTLYYRSYANMVAANLHKLNFINQRSEPHHEKEHVKISNAAKFQSCRPNTCRMVDPKIRDKCMAVSLPMHDCHTFVYYFWVFQTSAIPHVFAKEIQNKTIKPN